MKLFNLRYFMKVFIILALFMTFNSYALDVKKSVWANEAIVSLYTYDSNNINLVQKQLAKKFSADGWKNYLQALFASNIISIVKKNNFKVSSVATAPPLIKLTSGKFWQASMPLLVQYQNKKIIKKQNLNVVITVNDLWEIESVVAKKHANSCICPRDKPPQEAGSQLKNQESS